MSPSSVSGAQTSSGNTQSGGLINKGQRTTAAGAHSTCCNHKFQKTLDLKVSERQSHRGEAVSDKCETTKQSEMMPIALLGR